MALRHRQALRREAGEGAARRLGGREGGRRLTAGGCRGRRRQRVGLENFGVLKPQKKWERCEKSVQVKNISMTFLCWDFLFVGDQPGALC